MEELPIVAAGRTIPDALDRIRRYCGLDWPEGAPETWAWQYYDAVPTEHDDQVTSVDVLCAAALHPGLGRSDLAFFRDRREDLSTWLAEVPKDLRAWEVPEPVVEHLASVPNAFPDVSVSLLSKVLHRKRPHLIPLLDRHVVDWYRPVTGKRAMAEAWGPIIWTMRDDELDTKQCLIYSLAFAQIEEELWPLIDTESRPRLSWLRAIDIAIWMGSR